MFLTRKVAALTLPAVFLVACNDQPTTLRQRAIQAALVRGACVPRPPLDPRDSAKYDPPLDVGCRPVGSVTVSPDTLGLAPGQVAQLTATVRDNRGRDITTWRVTWSSSDISVASVDSFGAVLGVGAGTAVITAEAGMAADTALVIVKAAPLIALLSPAEGAYIYQYALAPFCNGTYGFQVQFSWTAVAGAVAYVLYEKGATALGPHLNLQVYQTSYTDTNCDSYIVRQNAMNWQWHVTAILDDGSTVTSDTGTFNFTDPFQP